MSRTVFTSDEVRYLASLPVVANATETRITYTRAFKRDCLARYLRGERPVDLFREAGLTPELIGRKRIDRCVARWKAERDGILADVDDVTVIGTVATSPVVSSSATSSQSSETAACPATAVSTKTATSAAASATTSAGTASSVTSVASNAPDASSAHGNPTSTVADPLDDDVRNRLIVQQVNYIDSLEREIAELRRQLRAVTVQSGLEK
ncbi:hypothetical protein JS533_001235 [Bifidobacterium amazonense]|uniref:Transposase n=1 Tax=Bifidobacterium amazonense TaxID=2809027 RepID=A0ABS9VS62_9BIFI|nr:hypothetical protein [Bifidobacterium amazonense]MCH9274912.1 hypothetical protein [Bifidobacterium amazonense]